MILPKSIFSNYQYFGLSINRSSVRAISLDKSRKVTSYAQLPLPENPLEGEVQQPKLITDTLIKLKQQGHFSSPYAAVVIPESSAFTREFSLPTLPINEIGEAISWQISKIFPFSPEEIYFDWKLLKTDPDQTTTLVVAVPKKILDSLRAMMEPAGIYPISFEPSVSAVSRIGSSKDQSTYVLIEVDSRGSAASLIKDGISLLTTTNSTIPGQQNNNLTNSVTQSVNSLLQFYGNKYNLNTQQVQFFLTGEKADQNLSNLIGAQLQRKTTLLSVGQITPPFHQAYAAAATQVLPPKSEQSINLIPTPLQVAYEAQFEQRVYKSTLFITLAALITSLAISGVSAGYQWYAKSNIAKELEILKQTDAAQKPISANGAIKNAGRVLELFPLKITPQEKLLTALDLLPPGLTVESISYTGHNQAFEIFGEAPNRDTLLNFRDALEKSPDFTAVKLPLGVFEQAEDINFKISFTINTEI